MRGEEGSVESKQMVCPRQPIDETGRSLSTLSNSSFEDLTNVDGALPSLYKFCARTATGVFQNTLNTLKTALPGNQSTIDQENEFISIENVNHWTYVASDLNENDLSIKMEKLLNERRAFCTVDNAYEAVESLDVLDQTSGWSSTKKYDDDIDDLELNIPLTKTLLDIFCESTPCLLPEALVKSILILFGSVIEDYLVNYSKKSLKSVNGMIGKLPNGLQTNPLALTKKELTEIFVDLIPGGLKYLVGEDLFRSAIETLVLSLQSQKINEDIFLQIFELVTSLVIEANCSLSPTYSA
nr:uncharacterized protein LOC111421873 [Onthophagus taurus]